MNFTETEQQFIIDNVKKISVTEIATRLQRKRQSVYAVIRRLNLIETQADLTKRGKRKCHECQRILPMNENNFNKCFLKDGALRWASKCRECASKASSKHYDIRLSSIIEYSKHVIPYLKRRKECSLVPEDILEQYNKQNGLCYYSKELMVMERRSFWTISVDRIDPSLPYQKDNIVLCCYAVNVMKNELSMNDFFLWCQKICENNKTNSIIHQNRFRKTIKFYSGVQL